MNNYYNPFERINFYRDFFSNDEDMSLDEDLVSGYTIRKITEKGIIPVEIVRRDVVALFKSQNIDFPIDIDESEYGDEDEKTFWRKYDIDYPDDPEFRKKLEDLIINGQFDDVSLNSGIQQDQLILPLSIDELEALRVFRESNPVDENVTKNFVVKNSYRFLTDSKTVDKLVFVFDSIRNRMGIKTLYLDQGKHQITVEFMPLKVLYDSMNNVYAALAVKDARVYVYRIDRMIGKPINIDLPYSEEDNKYFNHADQVWGMGFQDVTPNKVKVYFRNDKAGKIWGKVKRDLHYRAKGTLEERGNKLYYEDIVYGLTAFKSWIYSYGTSAVVLEPKELREEIIAMLKERIKLNENI